MALDEELLARNNQSNDESLSNNSPQDSVGRFNSGKAAAAKDLALSKAHKIAKKVPGAYGKVAQIGLKAAGKMKGGEFLKIIKKMRMGCFCFGYIIQVVAAFAFIALIVAAIENPLRFVYEIFGSLWRVLVGGNK